MQNPKRMPFVAGLLLAGFAGAMPGAVPADGREPDPGDPGRLVPAHRVSVQSLDLTRPPSEDELIAAGQLGGPLFPTHELSDKRREEAARWAFGHAINEWNKHEYPKAVTLFRKHVEEFPDSPWAGEATLHIACDATYNGRYTEAEAIFNQLIADNQGKAHPGAQMLLNKARQRLALLRVEQNNLAEARNLLATLLQESPDWRQRTYASHWIQRLSQFAAAKQALLSCGSDALAYALEREGRSAEAAQVRTNVPATLRGYTLSDLAKLATAHGRDLVAIEAGPADLARLSLPAILHITAKGPGASGHYWVLDKVQGDQMELYDPQSHHRFHQTASELAREWSGRALLFSGTGPIPGRKLQLSELEESSGGCCGVPPPEDDLGCPPCNKRMASSLARCCGQASLAATGAGASGGGGAGGASAAGGSASGGAGDSASAAPLQLGMSGATWFVNSANLNLFVAENPLWYYPAYGPAVAIAPSYNSQSAIAYNEPFGNKWAFNYGSYLTMDTAGLISVFMPDGRRDIFFPTGNGSYAGGYRVYNTLTALGPNHFELRFPDETVFVYQIPAGTQAQQPMLVEIRDAYSQTVSLGYDAAIHLTTITDALGQVTTLSYAASGLVTNVADPFGRHATFDYDANKNLIRVTDMGGHSTSFTYDPNVYLTSVADARGAWTFHFEPADGIGTVANSDAYPAPGMAMFGNARLTVTNPIGGKEEFFYYGGCDIDGYNGCDGYTWHVRPRDYIPWTSPQVNTYNSRVPKTRFLFDRLDSGKHGELAAVHRPEGDYELLTHNASTGDDLSSSDPYGKSWVYTYNWRGEVASATNPKGTRTLYWYGTNGVDVLAISNELGQVSLNYNSHHDLVSWTDQLSHATAWTYNSLGQLVARVDALGITNTYVYGTDARLSQVLRDGQVLTTFTRDPLGRIATRTDASGLTLTYEYNSMDRITRITYPDGKFVSFVYSTCCPDLVDSLTDRGGRSAIFTYDALKRLTAVANPEGGVTSFAYDANGNTTQLSDPNGNVTTFAYDLNDRLTRKTFPDGTSLTFSYDAGGRFVSRTDARGVSAAFTWDDNGNLLTIAYSDGTPGVTNTYDAFDRIVSVRTGVGTNSYAWDAASQLLSIHGPFGESLNYTHDSIGRRAGLSVQGAPPIGYLYDTLNRLLSVTNSAGSYTYGYTGASPMLQSLSRPNGSQTVYQYDPLKRLSSISNRRAGGQIISQFQYGYDSQDLCSSETISNGLPVTLTNATTVNTFNSLNQLLNSSPPRVFHYDLGGNLTQGYTPDGYLFTAAYDAENRLKSLSFTNGAGAIRRNDYFYNGSGFPVQVKTFVNGSLSNDSRVVYDGPVPIQERDGGNNVVRQYTWGLQGPGGLGGLLNLNQAGQNYSYIYDGKWNVVGLLDGGQATVAGYAYDPFGRTLAKAGTLDQPIRFSTKPYDELTGLATFPCRSYVPSLGRWLTRDPLGENGGINLYGYAGDSPPNYFDPYGLAADIVRAGVDTKLSNAARGMSPPDNEIWVVIHGNEKGSFVQDRKGHYQRVDAEDLAKQILALEKAKKARTVKLFSCKTGKGKFPTDLQRKLRELSKDDGFKVESPDERMNTGGTIHDGGKWVTPEPGALGPKQEIPIAL
jgi:RHS repeat-associated protein